MKPLAKQKAMVKKAEYYELLGKQTKPENIIPDELWVHFLHAAYSSHAFKSAGAELQNIETRMTRIMSVFHTVRG